MTPKRSKKNAGLPYRVTEKHGAYYYLKPVYRNGKNTTQWIRLGKTEREMYRRLAELKSEGSGLMSAIFQRYEDEVMPRKAEKTQKDQNRQLKRLKKAFGHMRPADLIPKHIARYHDLVGRDAPYQANREIALMTHVCKYGVRWGYLDENPCREIERFPENARERYVTHEEYVAVRDAAPVWVGIVMDIGYVTGQRRVDVLNMKRSDITQEGVLIQQSKTKAKLLIEWTPTLEHAITRALKELAPNVSSMYVVCDAKGQKRKDAAFQTAWTRLMQHCLEEGLIAERFQFRDIRGKAGSDSSGEQLGHKSPSTLNRHYKRLPKRVKPTR